MNIQRLKQVESEFLSQYPQGFNSPEMKEIVKKHKPDKMFKLAQESFEEYKFDNPEFIISKMIELVSKSSMVSLFEKPKYRDYIKSLSYEGKEAYSDFLKEFLHGNEKLGFNGMVEILDQIKLAKWTLVSVFGAYYRPTKEVFVKPTTTKNIINYLELDDLVYRPRPSYDFYKTYRAYINKMKKQVDKSLSPSNAAFTGFLMFSM